MKFSVDWLCQRIGKKISAQTLSEQLTMAGLEVNSVTSVADDFSGVVVGEVIACEPHPNAQKLRVTRVSVGKENFQVVCGAPNVRVGLKAPFACIQARLPGDFVISKVKLRGVESLGMLCSEKELGISTEDSRLMELTADAPTGADLRAYLYLDDQVIEVELTPNRGDCLSIEGIAREVAAISNFSLPFFAIEPVNADSTRTLFVDVQAPSACPCYLGRIITGVNPSQATTPQWMIERLRRAGIRNLDPVVDITNYVMLELGQPLHGFDLQKLQGGIEIRKAKAGEKLQLLNGNEIKLSEQTLLIADKKKPLCIAGVMGGVESGVNEETQDIFLEAAFFTPLAMAGCARQYGLHTDSSHRFERGVDPSIAPKAMERATAFIIEICGGQPGPVSQVISDKALPVVGEILLRKKKVDSLLGISLFSDQIERYLKLLGCNLIAVEAEQWRVIPPAWRFDLEREECLVEEVGRLYGYDKLPETRLYTQLKMIPQKESQRPLSAIEDLLAARGYREVISYSFIEPRWQKIFGCENIPIMLDNPISSEMSVMRTTLFPGLIKSLLYNQSRQLNRVKLFESGQVFFKRSDMEVEAQLMLGGVCVGERWPEHWQNDSRLVDFYDLKGDLEALLSLTGDFNSFQFVRGDHTALHPGQCADIYRNNNKVGVIGALNPRVKNQLSVTGNVFLFEINVESVMKSQVTHYRSLSKYPEVRRDIAIIVDTVVEASTVMNIIKSVAGEWLISLLLFDVYQGATVPKGMKSIALGMIWRHPAKTLKDEEINDLFNDIVKSLKNQVNAKLRQ